MRGGGGGGGGKEGMCKGWGGGGGGDKGRKVQQTSAQWSSVDGGSVRLYSTCWLFQSAHFQPSTLSLPPCPHRVPLHTTDH